MFLALAIFPLQDIEAFIKADPYVKADLVSSW